ncbi:hypothetical protein [Streptococcus intermedius]|uniref:hypothetical protein n=1 Tax=Streptococcus intermedius TaxID=1338 RepID=UPI0006618465|nr:hypothetical protein [Streptococcus intermedius]
MTKRTLFQASFEESLNLEDDGFLQYQLKEQNKKLAKLSKKGLASFKIKFLNLILTLLFPIGLNFLLLAVSISIYNSEPKDLALPISNKNFLTANVYLIGLLIWLLLILVGKIFKQYYIHPYRLHFHVMTFLIWFVFEFNLAALGLALPLLSIWGILIVISFIIVLTFWMGRVERQSLKKRIYNEVIGSTLKDKIANNVVAYGMGIIGLGVILSYILKFFSINFSTSITLLGLFLSWVVLNVGLVAMLVFLEFPYYLQAYYKWKYPEEYRKWEGKSLEEWYGKKYLKKHKELLNNE